jgi:hypothetical protein
MKEIHQKAQDEKQVLMKQAQVRVGLCGMRYSMGGVEKGCDSDIIVCDCGECAVGIEQ